MRSEKIKTEHACSKSKEAILDSVSPKFANEELIYQETEDLFEDAKKLLIAAEKIF